MSGGIKSGTTGCVFLLIACFMTLTILIIALASPLSQLQLWYQILSIVTSAILSIGVLLAGAGALKLGRYYKDALSKAAGAIGLVAGIMGIVGLILGIVALFVAVIAGVAVIFGFVILIITGVFLLLLGIAFVVVRDKIGRAGLAMGTGIMAIISGAMFCSVLISFIGIIILIPTAICAAMLFMRVKGVATEEAPKEGKKLAVKAVEAKPKKQKPADVEAEVYKYVKSHPSGIDVADCAESLGVSEGEVQKSINALVKKGKLELG